LRQALLQETSLGGLACQRKRMFVGHSRRVAQTEPALHVGAGGVGEVVVVEATAREHGIDGGKAGVRPVAHRDRDRAIQRRHRRGSHAQQAVVERHDLRPVGFVEAGGLAVERCDGRLQEIVDADKPNYHHYYTRILERDLLERDGLLVFDNTLWGGLVLTPGAGGLAFEKAADGRSGSTAC
jgi:hypothetical protein